MYKEQNINKNLKRNTYKSVNSNMRLPPYKKITEDILYTVS